MAYIKNLDIIAFRGITSLQLNDLSPINILTGDNNSGKTSVLEVIRSYENPRDFRIWTDLLRRGPNSPLQFTPLSLHEGFYDLFNINNDEKKIKYIVEGTRDSIPYRDTVLLTAAEGEEEMSSGEYRRLIGIYQFPDEEPMNESTLILPKIEIQFMINDELQFQIRLIAGQRRLFDQINDTPNKKEANKIVYVSPSSHTEGNIYLAEILKYPNLYEEMLEILKDYDEDIISINYDHDSRYPGRGIYKILSRSYKEALPLNVYGDGMKKAILLMSAVLKAQDGILLLDEFETAIHTSAMDRTFRWILETCLKLNVQVFLTSHSKEAIDKVLKCSEKVRENTALYTLYKEDDKTFVRRMSGEKALEAQDNMGLELR